jgi:hypothetical protein
MIRANELRFLVLHEGSRFILRRIFDGLILNVTIGDVETRDVTIGDVKVFATGIVSMQVGDRSFLS